MKVVQAGYQILTPISEGGIKELQHIEKIGRVCYKSEDKITEDGESAKTFVKMLINNRHEAMLEHGCISVLFTVDRGITHELVRHRVADFAQESTRYCNYSKGKFGNDITVIDIEPGIRIEAKKDEDVVKILNEWYRACEDAQRHYMNMLNYGASPQIARSVLPTSTKSDITVTANYREWRHILNLRAVGTTGKPHPQMLEVMIPLLKELQQKLPVMFDDIGKANL